MALNDTTERWLPVQGWEGLYSVSDFGRVRSEARVVAHGGRVQPIRERILVQGEKGDYLSVVFSRCGKTHTKTVHRLVLETFRGECPSGMESRHIDGNGKNSRLGNLEWGTPVQNADDKLRHGTRVHSERVGTARLTTAQATAIRLDNRSQQRIADEYGVSQGAVSKIKRGITWAHQP